MDTPMGDFPLVHFFAAQQHKALYCQFQLAWCWDVKFKN